MAGDELVDDSETAAESGGSGEARGSKRRRVRVSAAKMLALLRGPDFTDLTEAAHASVPANSPYKSKAIAHFAQALVADPREDIPVANYLAHLKAHAFRYVCDPTQDLGRGTALKLFQHEGALWKCSSNTESNLIGQLQAQLEQIVSAFEQGLWTLVERQTADQEDPGGSEASDRPARPSDLLAHLQLLASTYKRSVRFDRVFRQMKTRMQGDALYTEAAQPTPAEFYYLLDADQHVLGFENGVLSFREPGGAFRFYPAGAVPSRLAVSKSVGYDYEGPEEWPPIRPEADVTDANRFEMPGPEDYPPLAPWWEGMKAADAQFLRRPFFREAMHLAVAFLIGATLYGGNMAKKFAMFLGELGNNGKSRLLSMMQATLGNDYCTPIAKDRIVVTRALQNVTAADPWLSSHYNCRLAFCSENSKDDKINADKVKRWAGGDAEPVRANWGNYRPVVVQFVVWLASNYAARWDDTDKALVGRVYAVSCDAEFSDTFAADDPAEGRWRATTPADYAAAVHSGRNHLMLLFIWFARCFVDAGCRLPPAPQGSATQALRQSGASAPFELWFQQNYESTLKPGTQQVDWERHKQAAVTDLSELILAFQREGEASVTMADAAAALKRLGFEVKEFKAPAALAQSWHKKRFKNGVAAQQKPAAEDG